MNQKDEGDKPTQQTGAPEKYDAFTLPEEFGKDRELDETTLNEHVLPVFKELGLTQAQAQTLINTYAKLSHGDATQIATAITEQNTKWTQAIAADPDLKDLKTVRQNVGKMYDALSRDADGNAIKGRAETIARFREQMDLTGLGNMPEFVKIMNWVSEAYSEGRSVTGGKPSPLGQREPGAPPKSPGNALYGPSGPISGRAVQ